MSSYSPVWLLDRTDSAGTEPLELLVTFEQHCDCQPAPLRGCLRWRRP